MISLDLALWHSPGETEHWRRTESENCVNINVICVYIHVQTLVPMYVCENCMCSKIIRSMEKGVVGKCY